MKTGAIKDYFDKDPQSEEMLFLSEKVFENKTGEPMPPLSVKKRKLKGKPWREDNLKDEFSGLWREFEKHRGHLQFEAGHSAGNR